MEDFYEDDEYSDSYPDFSAFDERRATGLPKLIELLPDGPDFSPTQQSLGKGDEALTILSNVLLGGNARHALSSLFPNLRLRYSTNDLVTLGIIPIGFYALGLWKPTETISVCVAGTPSAETFFDLASTRFLAHQDSIIIQGFDKREVSFNLLISSIKLQITYHSNPLISKWSDMDKRDVNELQTKLSEESAEKFADLIKTYEVEKRISPYDINLVRKAYWTYSTWSQNLGLFPIVLGTEHILALAMYGMHAEIDPEDFNNFNLPMPVMIDGINDIRNSIGLDGKQIKQWRMDVTANMTGKSKDNSTGRYIQESKIVRDFSIPQWPIFFAAWQRYIRISVSFWGSSSTGAARWFSTIEEVIKKSMMQKSVLLKTRYHLWPCPFEEHREIPWMKTNGKEKTLAEHTKNNILRVAAKAVNDAPCFESEMDQTHFELSYFIGCDGPDGSLQRNIEWTSDRLDWRFEEALSATDRPYGSFDIGYLLPAEIEPVWYPYTLNLVPVPADLRKLDMDEDEDITPPNSPPPKRKKTKSSSKSKQKADDKVSTPATEHVGVYLRPAVDILHRLRHDSEFKTDDYLIGYLDRFKGVKEIALDAWTKEHTSQEFIPLTRIRYFKRKSDGEVVWDRDAKIDRIFGTGA